MGCEVTPASCLDPVNIFAGIYDPCASFGDPSVFQAERAIFSQNFKELITKYGVDVNYYVNGFNLSAMNLLYGEHPTQEYSGPMEIKAYIELEEGVSLAQFGMTADDELTAYVHIEDFNGLSALSAVAWDQNSQRYEPKADDLLELTALGCDRPGNRGPKIFIITEALDQSIQDGINPIMGHYIWKLTAKRYETSFETNAPMEEGNDQVYDNLESGKLSSAMYPALTSDAKIYDQNIDEVSRTDVYNQDNANNDIYGDYY